MIQTIHIPPGGKIACTTDPHEQVDHFKRLIDKVQPSPECPLVCSGDLFDKGRGKQDALEIARLLQDLAAKNSAYFVKGNHELKHLKKEKKLHNGLSEAVSPELFWVNRQPLALSFLFSNQTRVTVLHGGVTPRTTWENLGTDVEICYVREIDADGKMVKIKMKDNLWVSEKEGVIWHEKYDGRFGYIASGHIAQTDGKAKFYNYSCNLDSACYETGVLSCQIFSENGREELIEIKL